MPHDKIKEILKQGIGCSYHHSEEVDEVASLLTSHFLDIIEEARPKMKSCSNCPFNMLGKCGKWDKKMCFNQAIQLYATNLRKEMEGKK